MQFSFATCCKNRGARKIYRISHVQIVQIRANGHMNLCHSFPVQTTRRFSLYLKNLKWYKSTRNAFLELTLAAPEKIIETAPVDGNPASREKTLC